MSYPNDYNAWQVIGTRLSQPSECGLQRTLNSVYGHASAWLQSNEYLAV